MALRQCRRARRHLRRRHGPDEASAARCSGGAHIVVGTPGRLRDHLERGALDLSALRVAVLDEADEMLDMGFREELEEILDATPQERRTLLFSATMPRPIVALAKRYQKDALRIETLGDKRRPPGHRLSGGRGVADRHRACGGQSAALPRGGDDDPVLRHPRSGAPAPRQPDRARLPGRRAVGRAQPERAQPCAAGAARPARAGLRRHRRRRARHRPAVGVAGRPRRASARRRGAAAPLGPHRPRRAQGHRHPHRPLPAPQARRGHAARRAHRCRVDPGPDRRARSAPRTASGCSPLCRSRPSSRTRTASWPSS